MTQENLNTNYTLQIFKNTQSHINTTQKQYKLTYKINSYQNPRQVRIYKTIKSVIFEGCLTVHLPHEIK